MPREKKVTNDPAGKDAKYTDSVKLTKAFKRRLQRVAEHENMHMGELIEAKIGQFVNTTWLKLIEEDRKRDEVEAASLRGKA